MTALRSIPEEKVNSAFQKAEDGIKIGGVKLVRITENYFDEALDFIRINYLQEAVIYQSFGVEWNDDVRDMFLAKIRDKRSLMLVRKDTLETVALAIIEVVNRNSINCLKLVNDERVRRARNFMNECDDKSNFFVYYCAEEAFQIGTVTTSKKYRHSGYGTAVVEVAFAIVRNLDIGNVCVKVLASSVYSQRIFEKLGMECLYMIRYNECERIWNYVLSTTEKHEAFKVYGIIV